MSENCQGKVKPQKINHHPEPFQCSLGEAVLVQGCYVPSKLSGKVHLLLCISLVFSVVIKLLDLAALNSKYLLIDKHRAPVFVPVFYYELSYWWCMGLHLTRLIYILVVECLSENYKIWQAWISQGMTRCSVSPVVKNLKEEYPNLYFYQQEVFFHEDLTFINNFLQNSLELYSTHFWNIIIGSLVVCNIFSLLLVFIIQNFRRNNVINNN